MAKLGELLNGISLAGSIAVVVSNVTFGDQDHLDLAFKYVDSHWPKNNVECWEPKLPEQLMDCNVVDFGIIKKMV